MKNLKETKEKVKFIIYFFLNLNLFFIIVLIILLLTYIIIYLLTIFQILNDIYLNLKEKIGELSIKDIIRKKIDNLNLLLKFYENDINKIMKDLNNIYNDYKDNYNLKIKEEEGLFKKEEKNEIINKNKNVDLSSIIKI